MSQYKHEFIDFRDLQGKIFLTMTIDSQKNKTYICQKFVTLCFHVYQANIRLYMYCA